MTTFDTIRHLLEKRQGTSAPRALFLAGPPGSGKSTVARDVLAGLNVKMVNIDDIVEFLAKKRGVKWSDQEAVGQIYRDARPKNVSRRDYYMQQGYNLVIDGTGRDPAGIDRVKRQLEANGYETGMLFVAVDYDVAYERNKSRGIEGREADPLFAYEAYNDVMSLVRHYDQEFRFFFYVKNQDGSDHPQSGSSQAKRLVRRFMSGDVTVTGQTDL